MSKMEAAGMVCHQRRDDPSMFSLLSWPEPPPLVAKSPPTKRPSKKAKKTVTIEIKKTKRWNTESRDQYSIYKEETHQEEEEAAEPAVPDVKPEEKKPDLVTKSVQTVSAEKGKPKAGAPKQSTVTLSPSQRRRREAISKRRELVQGSRFYSNTKFSKIFSRPVFELFGHANTEPIADAMLEGDYMRTHSVLPLQAMLTAQICEHAIAVARHKGCLPKLPESVLPLIPQLVPARNKKKTSEDPKDATGEKEEPETEAEAAVEKPTPKEQTKAWLNKAFPKEPTWLERRNQDPSMWELLNWPIDRDAAASVAEKKAVQEEPVEEEEEEEEKESDGSEAEGEEAEAPAKMEVVEDQQTVLRPEAFSPTMRPEVDPRNWKFLPPDWTKMIPPAGVKVKHSDRVKDILLFDMEYL